jgi:serpin B
VTKLSEAKTGYELTTANRMYAQEGLALLPNFVAVLSKHYRNEVHAVDFKTQADNVTKKINDWVSETTKQRIKDFLAPGVLTAATRLVLVNAIYFKGAWDQQFKESNTEKATFYAAANKEITVRVGY